MPHYFFAYLGGEPPKTPEQGQADMQRWKNWVAELGKQAIIPGAPLKGTQFVTTESVVDGQIVTSQGKMSGFSVIEAEDMDEAIRIAQNCPFSEQGHVAVSEILAMP